MRVNDHDFESLADSKIVPHGLCMISIAKAVEQTEEFVKARRAHSAVESAIHALEVHGLDKCPDHGMGGFKRYVALAIVARNIRRIGDFYGSKMWSVSAKLKT